MMKFLQIMLLASVVVGGLAQGRQTAFADSPAATRPAPFTVHYRTAQIDGVNLFYREAGPADGPVVLLLLYRDDRHAALRALLDTGHFALEDQLDVMAPLIRGFLDGKVYKR
jgi:hypothetical protein